MHIFQSFVMRDGWVNPFGFALLVVLSALAPMSSFASDKAEAFSDPGLKANVPASWKKKPVTHEPRYADADLVVALGQQTFPVFSRYIDEYARQNNLNIVVQQGTCGISSGKLLRKTVDIAAFCCPPARSDRFPGTQFHSLGIAPIALIVHPTNPVDSVTLDEARKIFKGAAPAWSDVKPKVPSLIDRSIQPVGRLHCKIRPGHWRTLLPTEDRFSSRLYEVGVIPDMISQVARNPGAIGWETPLMVRHFSANGEVKMLRIGNMDPTDTRHTLNGDWPFYRTYHLVTWTQSNRSNVEARKLVAYLRNKVENVYEEIAFVPPSKLKEAGWRFHGEELVAEPGQR